MYLVLIVPPLTVQRGRGGPESKDGAHHCEQSEELGVTGGVCWVGEEQTPGSCNHSSPFHWTDGRRCSQWDRCGGKSPPPLLHPHSSQQRRPISPSVPVPFLLTAAETRVLVATVVADKRSLEIPTVPTPASGSGLILTRFMWLCLMLLGSIICRWWWVVMTHNRYTWVQLCCCFSDKSLYLSL